MEKKNKCLLDFKISKVTQEKDLRKQIKDVNKKVKNLREREAKLDIEQQKFNKVETKQNRKAENESSNPVETNSPNESFSSSSVLFTTSNTADITSYPSMVSHWLATAKQDPFDDPNFCKTFLEKFQELMNKNTETLTGKKVFATKIII